MMRIRLLIAPAAALAVASGIALLPALTLATPASAQASCDGTSLILGFDESNNTVGAIRVPTLGNGTGNTDCILGAGNAGPAVARLQIALDECNLHAGLAVDSDYGPLTRQAVINVQRAEHVTQDGVFGPMTGILMHWPQAGSNGTICDIVD